MLLRSENSQSGWTLTLVDWDRQQWQAIVDIDEAGSSSIQSSSSVERFNTYVCLTVLNNTAGVFPKEFITLTRVARLR